MKDPLPSGYPGLPRVAPQPGRDEQVGGPEGPRVRGRASRRRLLRAGVPRALHAAAQPLST